MIRFGVIVTVVVAAIGLLVVGAVAGDLTLVYVSIALAAVALLLLIVGVAVWRDEVFASSARRDDRDLAAVGAVGHVGRAGTGPGAVEGWPGYPPPTARPGPTPAAGPQGGDTREFLISAGALPDREAPADRDRRGAEPRLTEQPSRPADPAARRGREVRQRDRAGREAGTPDWPGRDLAATDFSGRETAAAGWPGPDLAAAGRSGRDAAVAGRPGRDAAPDDRQEREPAAADWAARETLSGHRPDRVERYPTMAGPDHYESADDPTRLAHRLDSLAEFGRPADLDATGSPRSRAVRQRGERPPAAVDPLAGAIGERRPAAEPVVTAPPTGRPAGRPTETERGPGADADTAQPASAVLPGLVSPGPASATPVAASTASGTTAAATAKDLGSRGPVPPAESRQDRPEGGRNRPDKAAAGSPAGSSAWPDVPAAADARLSAEADSTAAAGLIFPASPGRAPAASDEGQTATVRAAAAPAPAATAAAADTSAATEPDAPAGTGPAESASTAATDGGAVAGPAIGLDDQVSVVPGIARFHKADCILIRFLSDDDLEVMSRRDAEAAGCAPCRACRPDRPADSD